MLSTVTVIPLNDQRKEIIKHGVSAFPCQAYIGVTPKQYQRNIRNNRF